MAVDKYKKKKAYAPPVSLAEELKLWDELGEVERALVIFELRKTGFCHAAIAQATGLTTSAVAQIIKGHTEERRKLLDQAVDDLRELECARLDEATKALWPDVKKGNSRSIEVLLKVMERRAKLKGLDAPEKHVTLDLTDGLNQLSTPELVEMAKRLGLPTPDELPPLDKLLPGEGNQKQQEFIETEIEFTKDEQEQKKEGQ